MAILHASCQVLDSLPKQQSCLGNEVAQSAESDHVTVPKDTTYFGQGYKWSHLLQQMCSFKMYFLMCACKRHGI